MGATPRIRIEAATLPGGVRNQDRYAYGDGWAFVLDGASSFSATNSAQDGGWYAERLRQALSRLLPESNRDTADIVAEAIAEAASAYDGDPAACPTSTISLSRWHNRIVETYVLGDSVAVLVDINLHEHVKRDDRITKISPSLRRLYKQRLVLGTGFDLTHREILGEIQQAEILERNQLGGYWIAGGDPKAAHHARRFSAAQRSCRAIFLATDGAAQAIRTQLIARWFELGSDISHVLSNLHKLEESDSMGQIYPRSKRHDDKTIVRISRI